METNNLPETSVELVVVTPEIKGIQWNKEDVQKWAEGISAKYKGLVFGDDQVKEAKRERAKLNALKKEINDKRIAMKDEYMTPYRAFAEEVNKVIDIIEKPIRDIDLQVKHHEERKREEKKKSLRDFFEANAKDLKEYISFEKVFDERYLNVTVSLKKAEEDILAKIKKVGDDVSIIISATKEYSYIAIDSYKMDGDVSLAIERAKKVESVEEEKKKTKTSPVIEPDVMSESVVDAKEIGGTGTGTGMDFPAIGDFDERKEQEEKDREVINPFVSQTTDVKEKQYRSQFVVYGTKEQLIKLQRYMKEIGVTVSKE